MTDAARLVPRTGRVEGRVPDSSELPSPPMIARKTALAALLALCAAWAPGPWGYVRVEQPQDEEPDVDAVELGPAIGEAQLAPYFQTPALKSALSARPAGRPPSPGPHPPARATGPARWP